MRSVVILLSGGLDSATALAKYVALYGPAQLAACGMRYPSRHNGRELQAARQIAARYGVPFAVFDLTIPGTDSALLAGGNGRLTGAATVIKGRNLLFIAQAAIYAASLGAGEVVFSGHKGDYADYPDCRPQFVEDAGRVTLVSGVRLVAPFIEKTKREIVQDAGRYGVPIGLTWSCYAGGEIPCGDCGACVERGRGFAEAGVSDPARCPDAP